jgi:PII-like signaling protein
MTFTGRGKQLTIFISETDQFHHQALYMAIIEMLRRAGCSGATAVRGVAGFGASSMKLRTHTSQSNFRKTTGTELVGT